MTINTHPSFSKSSQVFIICFTLALSFFMILAITPVKAMDVDKAEYLRLKVISNTLYERSMSNPDWDQLVRPTWLNFRQLMKEFLIETLENNQSKAQPPAGIVSTRIIWQDMQAGPKIVEFNQVPEPWFYLQASDVNNSMDALDELMEADMKDEEALINHFEIIRNAVIDMAKPPFLKAN